MKTIPLLFALAFSTLAHTPAFASEPEGAEKKPGFFQKMNPFRKKVAPNAPVMLTTDWEGLKLSMLLEPGTIKLAETRQVQVKLQLTNATKKFRQLEFPTTQRIEIIIRSRDGKLVEQWSEDQAFTSNPGIVSINPGERVEYNATIATRDLVAGTQYVLEAFFPNYENLRVQTMITPEP